MDSLESYSPLQNVGLQGNAKEAHHRLRHSARRVGGNYHSEQTHIEYVNGKQKERRQIVDINGKNGTKTVIVTRNGKKHKSTKSLSPKEISCIRKCQFMPGLFNEFDKCIR